MQATIRQETFPYSRRSVFVVLLSILFLVLVAASLGNALRSGSPVRAGQAQEEAYPAFDGDATALPGIEAAYLTGQ